MLNPITKSDFLRYLECPACFWFFKNKPEVLGDIEELLEFFEKHKKELVEVKNRIDATDKEIDRMVFDLYGLSEEERGVVGG